MSFREYLEKDESIIFRMITFRDIKESLESVFGKASNSILYHAAIGAGRRSCRRRLEAAKSREDALKMFIELKANQNWGEITFEEVDWEKHSGKISIAGSFEARGVRSKEPCCYFFKGYLVGFLSEFLQSEVVLSEDRCVAKEDKRCEFTFRKVKE